MPDLYQALGLERTATADQIKKAYRKLTAKYHPDKQHNDKNRAEAGERFKEISSAYEVLSDPERRLWYDEFGAASLERGFDPDIAREQTRQHTWRGTPVTPTSNPFEEILQSVVEMMGQVQALPVPFLEALRGGKVKLPSGIVLGDVPPGTQTGDLLTFVNPKNHDGPPISMRVTVLSHPSLTRIGNNLAMLLPVTLAEAYRGGPITISGPWGNLDFRLPQGIHHGEKRRLAGHGVRVPGRPPGDLVVEIVLVYPAAGDEALEAALARLQGDWSPRAPV